VVRVVDVKGTTRSLVDIYTLRTGAWRSFSASGLPYKFSESNSGGTIFFNGAVHWPACTREHQRPFRHLIVSFDMKDEVFREMAVPKRLQCEGIFRFFLWR
jgi:F-box interacting protein